MKKKDKKPKEKKRRRNPPDKCLMIQWGETYTVNGVPCCPECDAPAEMVIGVLGNPCWAHK